MAGYIADLMASASEKYAPDSFLEDPACSLTFSETFRLAAQVARQIECQDGEPVLLYSGRDVDSYIAWIAGYLAGGVVCPIRKDTPPGEVRRLRDLLGARTILNAPIEGTLAHIGPQSAAGARRSIAIDTHGSMPPSPSMRGIAYLVQTSGSTGVSKVVKVPNHALACYAKRVVPSFGYRVGSRLSANFSMTFDLSVSDLVGALVSGATLCLPRGAEHLTPRRYIASRRLTHWYGTPSLTRTVSALREKPQDASECVAIMFCGEQLFGRDVNWARETAPSATVVNLYGPAELTLTCSHHEIPPDTPPMRDEEPVSAGWPYSHLEWAIGSDRSHRELLVRGPQMYAGYVGIASDAKPDAGTRHYATGDDFLQTEHGLTYIGRIDRQVKVFGVRIELAGVEQQIRAVAGVRDVLVIQGADQRLVAYVSGEAIEASDIENALRVLPNEALPSRIHITTGDLPRNASGKIDAAGIGQSLGTAR